MSRYLLLYRGPATPMDEFTEERWITVQSGSHPFPF